MTYTAILVHSETEAACARRVGLAADLANAFGARLIGVAAEVFLAPGAGGMAPMIEGDVLAAEAEVVKADLKAAEAAFKIAAAHVKAGAEFRSAIDFPVQMLARQARAADLIVIGPRRNDPMGFHTCADPGDLIMQAGRPVLLVPPDLARLDASSVLVAWKDTRESRRALADAMPFLKAAKQVLVAEICEHGEEAAAGVRLADVSDHLARHGVKASTTVRAKGKDSVTAEILNIANMQDAGLVVAGGYGHARLREWMFGGVTQDIVEGFPKAVLFSH